jgi:DNA uptake lipoprotein
MRSTCRRLRQLHRRGDPLRHPASRQPGRRLRAIPDRSLALRPDPGHLARPGPHREGDRGAGRGDPQISDSEYATSAKAKLEGARDQLAGKEMDVGRYYMEKRDYTAAINRFKTVVTRIRPRGMSRKRWRG